MNWIEEIDLLNLGDVRYGATPVSERAEKQEAGR